MVEFERGEKQEGRKTGELEEGGKGGETRRATKDEPEEVQESKGLDTHSHEGPLWKVKDCTLGQPDGRGCDVEDRGMEGLRLTLQKTRMIPPKKQMVPLSFCLREKNRNVF